MLERGVHHEKNPAHDKKNNAVEQKQFGRDTSIKNEIHRKIEHMNITITWLTEQLFWECGKKTLRISYAVVKQ